MRGAMILASGAWLALACSVRAELRFETDRIELSPPAGTESVSAEFRFENTGEKPVRITEVRSDCGCTAAVLERDLILPGKSGRIRADFNVGMGQGRNQVAIVVSTDEGRPSPYVLTLEANITLPVTVSPRLVVWRIGAQPDGKTVRVTFDEGYEFVGAKCSTLDFVVEVVARGEHYADLKVSPRDLWAKRNGMIVVTFNRVEGTPLEIPVQLRIL